MASVAEIKRDVLSKRGRYTVFKDNLHAKEVIVGDGERRKRYILCYNPKEAERQRKAPQMIVACWNRTGKPPDTIATANGPSSCWPHGDTSAICVTTKSGQIRIDRGAVRQAAKYDGKWVLETNDDTISLEDAACGYKGLMVIERCFRSLKRTQIK
jgi:hypothetical protein